MNYEKKKKLFSLLFFNELFFLMKSIFFFIRELIVSYLHKIVKKTNKVIKFKKLF